MQEFFDLNVTVTIDNKDIGMQKEGKEGNLAHNLLSWWFSVYIAMSSIFGVSSLWSI